MSVRRSSASELGAWAAMIEVVAFSPIHQAGVVEVIVPIQQAEFGIPIALEGQPDLLDIPGFYQQGRGNFWVAAWQRRDRNSRAARHSNDQAALRKMFVKAAFRGRERDVADHLLQTLFEWCRVRGIREVFRGTTAKFLAAHRFYEKNGFNEIAKADLPASFPLMSVDAKFYRRALSYQGAGMEPAP